MNEHVSTSYFEQHRLASIRRCLKNTATAFVFSRIEHCITLLLSSTHDVTSYMQRPQSNATPAIKCIPKSANISTETALRKVVNDLFLSLNKGNISVLALLDFSSAFDKIDHPILAHRLHTDLGFTDPFLQWFSFYLTDRIYYVSLSNHYSAFFPAHSGVPQGSVRGPILFTMYIKPLSAIIDSHSVIHHSFADDIQIRMSAPQDGISELLHSMQPRIGDVKAWATANMLKLNDNKTELMLVTSRITKYLYNLPTSITIGNAHIPFKQSVKNLDFTFDCHLTMNAHVSNIVRTCYFEQRRFGIYS